VAGEAAEARRRQPRALLRERVAEGPVGDEAVPPARTHASTGQRQAGARQAADDGGMRPRLAVKMHSKS